MKPYPLNCLETRQQPENMEESVELEFLATCKCMSDQGFLTRRGVLELGMSIEACMTLLSWLGGGAWGA